jgi:hypothetical protein
MSWVGKLAAAAGIGADAATQQYLALSGRFVAAEPRGRVIAFLRGPGGRDIWVPPVEGRTAA